MKVSKRVKRYGAGLLAGAMAFACLIPSGVADAGLAKGEKFLGNIIGDATPPSNFSTYWNQITPENASKWGAVEGSRDRMNWGDVDTYFDFAKKNNFPFKFHTLVWGSQEPGWIGSLSNAEKKAEVVEWIQAAAAKYGTTEYIDVVNEPLHAKPSFKDAIGGDGKTGWDWVIWSFEQARENFKNSKLLINEYGIINDSNAANNYIKIINLLKERGLVDGIGIQCHMFNVNTASKETMKKNLDLLAATGLPIYVSELDLDGDDTTQLNSYKEKFPVLWEHPAVKGVTLWGYIQGKTWKDNTHLVNSSGQERPAMKWLRTYLGSTTPTPTIPVTPTPGITVSPTPRITVSPTPRITVSPTPEVTPIPEGKLVLDTNVNAWNTGYTMRVDITNKSDSAVSDWKLTVKKADFNISSIWNAKVTESGDSLIITPVSFNKTISAGGTVTFGFQGVGTPVSDFKYAIE